MRGVVGIVAEFNPFHNGHEALVRTALERGAQGVVAVMSGNFVQRGSIAVADKRVRAKAALLSGVDLVLELPLIFAAGPAQRFARGAVETLAAAGCVDGLIFGSESGDIGALRALADCVDDPAFAPAIRERLAGGITFAKARELAAAERIGPDAAAALAGPNNLLAVEYLRAAHAAGWPGEMQTVRRTGAAHDGAFAAGAYASASFLRARADDFEALRRYAPARAAQVYEEAHAGGRYPANPAKLEIAVLSCLRRRRPEDLAALPDLSEGIENRLYAAIRRAGTMAELESAVKTKRYTMARVRRLILAAFLGFTDRDGREAAPYLRVIGCTQRGSEILCAMKSARRLPASHSLARLRALGGLCERFAEMEARSTDLYGLALPAPPACGYEYSASAVFIKSGPGAQSFP